MLRWTQFVRCAQAAGLSAALQIYGKAFTVTPRTWQRITEKNAQDGFRNDERYLRLAIESGGCHGFLYKFSFEPAKAVDVREDVLLRASELGSMDADTTLSSTPSSQQQQQQQQQQTAENTKQDDDSISNALQCSPCVVVDKISASKMANAVLDYHSELKGAAFVVVGNELVDQSCACAMSFSLRKHNHHNSNNNSTSTSNSSGRMKHINKPTSTHTASSTNTNNQNMSGQAAKDRPSGRATAIRR